MYPQTDGSVLDDGSPLPPVLSDITYQRSLWWRRKGETQFHLISPSYTPFAFILYSPVSEFPPDLLFLCSPLIVSLFFTPSFVFFFLLSISFCPLWWPYVANHPPLPEANPHKPFFHFSHMCIMFLSAILLLKWHILCTVGESKAISGLFHLSDRHLSFSDFPAWAIIVRHILTRPPQLRNSCIAAVVQERKGKES